MTNSELIRIKIKIGDEDQWNSLDQNHLQDNIPKDSIPKNGELGLIKYIIQNTDASPYKIKLICGNRFPENPESSGALFYTWDDSPIIHQSIANKNNKILSYYENSSFTEKNNLIEGQGFYFNSESDEQKFTENLFTIPIRLTNKCALQWNNSRKKVEQNENYNILEQDVDGGIYNQTEPSFGASTLSFGSFQQ